MAVAVKIGDPNNPPVDPPQEIPPPGPLPPCVCGGDCDGDGHVTIDEIVRGVTLTLGGETVAVCPSYDTDLSGSVTVDELVKAVTAALSGCTSAIGTLPR
jgi:hypothetical protein